MEINSKYKIFVISIFFVLLAFGIYVGFNFSNNGKKSKETIANTENINIYNTNNKNTKLSDIQLIYNDYYSLCNETITKSEMIYSKNVEKLIEEEVAKQKKDNLEYEIDEKNDKKLVFKRVINQNCPNHFNVKLENGIIVIYNIVSEGLSLEYQTINVPQNSIRPEMLEELNKGIRVNSKEELNLLIEDIES
ncbi:MAG: hypothetical protein RSA08_01395 [Clostridia bacterium]